MTFNYTSNEKGRSKNNLCNFYGSDVFKLCNHSRKAETKIIPPSKVIREISDREIINDSNNKNLKKKTRKRVFSFEIVR